MVCLSGRCAMEHPANRYGIKVAHSAPKTMMPRACDANDQHYLFVAQVDRFCLS